ncbi:hypothetical protein SFRURICE_008825 [Spodoptera frugiperda]|nr:hypothetical protein SFRURICE_008825 [Spodoptera frugiperda]
MVKLSDIGNERCILRGSFHQSHSKFNDYSRGKQCTANAAVAIAVSKIKRTETWTSDMIDSILISGDHLYTSSIRSRRAPTLAEANIEYLRGNRVDSDQYSITKITHDVHSLIQNLNEPENDTMAIRNTHHTTQSPNDLNNDNIVITSSVLRVIDVPISELSTVIANDNCSQLPVHQLRRKTESPLQITRERRAEELSWFHLFPYGRNGLQENRPHPITPLDSVKPR